MKNLLFVIFALATFNSANANPLNEKKSNRAIICGGWTDTYDTLGNVNGKRSTRCWTAKLGWHTVTILYKY